MKKYEAKIKKKRRKKHFFFFQISFYIKTKLRKQNTKFQSKTGQTEKIS